MMDLAPFGFRPGNSLTHRLDVRFKIGCMLALTIAVLHAGSLALIVISAITVALMADARLALKSMLTEMKLFLVLLTFVLLARSITTPGSAWIGVGGIWISREGLGDGLLICWRLVLVVGLGLLLTFSTSSSQIRSGIEALLKPIPLVPERHLATMLGLVLRFIPEILNQAKECTAAQKARCIENRRNPVRRLIRLTIPLFRKVFLDAAELSMALESRCYGHYSTPRVFSAARRDWLALGVVGGVCLLVFLF